MQPKDRQQLLRRVREEYEESPGLNLTKPQIRRFMGVDDKECNEVVDALLTSHFLVVTDSGQYVHPN